MTVLFGSSYVDFNDYNTPVKTFLDDSHSFKVMPGYFKFSRTFFVYNQANFQDSLVDATFSSHDSFYSIETATTDLYLASQTDNSTGLINVGMYMGDTEKLYERSVFNILELSGQLGGLYEAFDFIGGISVKIFASKLLMMSLINNLYHVKSDQDGNKKDDVFRSRNPHAILAKISKFTAKRPNSAFNFEISTKPALDWTSEENKEQMNSF